jgi:Ca2+/H+ antiporter, TMEM165/GDT1 family
MDWRLIATTFATVFLAELGDKTQLATLTFAAGGKSRLSVFIGSAAALVASSAIAVLVGEGLSRVIPARYITRLAGIGFLAIGAWVLYRSFKPES